MHAVHETKAKNCEILIGLSRVTARYWTKDRLSDLRSGKASRSKDRLEDRSDFRNVKRLWERKLFDFLCLLTRSPVESGVLSRALLLVRLLVGWSLSTERISNGDQFQEAAPSWPYALETIVPFRLRPIVSRALPYPRYQAPGM